MTISAEDIGHEMFLRCHADDGSDPALVELAWISDPGIRTTWTATAEHAIQLVARTCIACHPAVDQATDLPGQMTIDEVSDV